MSESHRVSEMHMLYTLSTNLSSQLSLPLVGTVWGRTANWTLAEDRALGEVTKVTALVKCILPCQKSGF